MSPAPTLETAANNEIFPSAGVQGRFYTLGQALAHEQQRSADLQAQLDERSHQIEQLQSEVQQLRQHENELQAAVDRATAGQAGQAAAARAGAAHGRQRGDEADDAQASVATDHAGSAEKGERTAAIASLRSALAKELLRREAAETELERLKAETSTPALADTNPANSAAELAAAKKEIADLRNALENERDTRGRLADKLEQIEQHPAPATDGNASSAELQARIRTLEKERQEAIDSFNHNLAASEEHAGELERQLIAARAANAAAADAASPSDGSGPTDLASIRAENTALRERLDEEHRRTEQLSSKLKLATRVTDLIFKMQSQQAQAAGQAPGQVPAVPQSNPWLDR